MTFWGRSAAKDPLGRLTEFGYDVQGRLITTTRYLSGTPVVTLNHYDVLGNRVGQTDALGHTSTYVYDDLNQLVATVSAEGVVTVQGYDAFGRVVTTTDGLGHQTVSDYDVLGQRVAVTDAEGNVTRYEYDGLGNQVAITDAIPPDGTQADGVRTSYLYDGLNRLVAVIENDTGGAPTHDSNVLTQYVYNVLGNRIIITNALGFTSSQTTFDVLGRPIVVEDALGHQTRTQYNALGYRTVVTDANDAVTRYSYDGLNRLSTVHYVSDNVTVTYRYDALGNRSTMTDALGVTHYVYDELYRLVSVTDLFIGTVSYGYDLAGNRTRLTYPEPAAGSGQGGRVVSYTYDADNRLVQVEDWDSGTTHYAYDMAGRLISSTLPNGVATTYQYDAANRLLDLAHTAADDTLLSSYSYELDGTGNRVKMVETLTETTRTITYTYDHLYRLTEAEYATGENFQYTYDAVGNRTTYTATITQTTVIAYEYDDADRLVNAGGVAYTWDELGRLRDDGMRSYAWNAAGRLISVTLGDATTRFEYNGDGDRLSKAVNGTLTTYTLDVAARLPQVLVERSGETATLYLYGLDLVGEQGTAWAYHLSDGLGSLRQLVDGSGQVTLAQGTRPFGGSLWQAGSGSSSFGYTGEQVDASTGLVFLRARYYEPGSGRFSSQDLWWGHPRLSQTLNRYTYVENNPANLTDPSGHVSVPNPSGCGEPQCYIFYFPGTGKVTNDYSQYSLNEINFIEEQLTEFGADNKAVVFPFAKGDNYDILDILGSNLLEEKRVNPVWSPNRAQLLQLETIRENGYGEVTKWKATEIGMQLRQWGVIPELQDDSVEIDFVAHSGGTHIALNTARLMPWVGYRVDDVVGLGGLFKAHEWAETGSLSSIDHFYDILSDVDLAQLARNGLMPVWPPWDPPPFKNFNYTAWHSNICQHSGLPLMLPYAELLAYCHSSGFGDLPNVTRIHAGRNHSDYWTDSGVNNHLHTILCENKK